MWWMCHLISPSGYHQCNGDTNSIYLLRLLGGLSKIMYVKCFEQTGIYSFCVSFCCFCSVAQLCLTATPQTAAHQASLSFPISPSLLKLMSIELVMPSNHLIPFHPLLFLLSVFSSIRVFSNELAICIRWPKYWSFSSSPFNKYPGLISFRIDWSEKAMATHSSTLAWKIPWTEEPGGLQSMGSLRVGHDWATSLSLFTFMHWRRKWQPTPVFLLGESQGQGSLVGCRLWGRTESDTTEAT